MPKPKKAELELISELFDLSSVATPPPEPAPAPPPEPAKPKGLNEEQCAELDRALSMIHLLIDLDMGKDWVAVLMSLWEEITLEQYRYLAGPLIHHQSGWAESLKSPSVRWLYKAIYKSRLEIVIEEMKTGETRGMASPAEVLFCMYPCTMDAPLCSNWADVYFWVCDQTFTKYLFPERYPDGIPKADGGTYKDYWEFAHMSPISYDRIRWDYESLARDLRDKVVRHAQQTGIKLDRYRFGGKEEPTPAKPANHEVLALFDA